MIQNSLIFRHNVDFHGLVASLGSPLVRFFSIPSRRNPIRLGFLPVRYPSVQDCAYTRVRVCVYTCIYIYIRSAISAARRGAQLNSHFRERPFVDVFTTNCANLGHRGSLTMLDFPGDLSPVAAGYSGARGFFVRPSAPARPRHPRTSAPFYSAASITTAPYCSDTARRGA